MRKAFIVVAAVAVASCSNDSPGPHGGGTAEIEPNDTIETATPIATNVGVAGSIASYSDSDFYAFNVPAPGATVRIQTFDPSGVTCNGIDTFLQMYDSTGTYLGWSDDTGVALCEDYAALRSPGTHYVAVSGISPAQFPYRVIVTLTP